MDVIGFSLFERYSKLAALSLSQESFKKNCERIVRNITDDELAEAFLPWKDLFRKDVHVGGKNIQKQPSSYSTIIRIKIISVSLIDVCTYRIRVVMRHLQYVC